MRRVLSPIAGGGTALAFVRNPAESDVVNLPSPQLYEATFRVLTLLMKRPKHFQVSLVYRLALDAAALTLEDQGDAELADAFHVFARRLDEDRRGGAEQH